MMPGPRPPARRGFSVGGHRQTLVLKRHVEGVLPGIIGDRPQAAGVVVAADDVVAVLLEQLVIVDAGLAGFQVDAVHVDVGIVVGERPRPQELAGRLLEGEHAAALGDRDHDVALLVRHERRADPFDVLGIGADAGVHENALVIVIRVPVVAGQLLVVPDELAGLRRRARPSSCYRDRPARSATQRRRCRAASAAYRGWDWRCPSTAPCDWDRRSPAGPMGRPRAAPPACWPRCRRPARPVRP